MKTRKSKLQKVLVLVLAAILVLGTMVACSKAPADTTTDTKGTEGTKQTEATKDPADYPVVTWYLSKDPLTDGDLVEERLNELLHENGIEANLDLIFQGGYNEKMTMMATAGEPFDLAFTCSWTFNYATNARKGAFLELTDLLAEYGQDVLEFFPEDVLESSKVDGKLYALPNWQLSVHDTVYAIPTRLVEKYNLDLSGIKAAKDLEPILEVIKENEPELIPVLCNNLSLRAEELDQGMAPFYQDLICITDDLKVVFPEEMIIEDCKMKMDWYQKGYIRQDINSVTDDNAEKLALKYALWTETDKKPSSDTMYHAMYGEPITVIPVLDHQVKDINADMSAMTAIGANSKHPELAMQILNFANTNKDFYNTMCYGVEGVHWNKNDNGSITMTDAYVNYNPNCDWMFGCQWNAYPKDTMELDVYEKMMEYSAGATVLPCSGFLFDNSNVLVELTNFNSIRNEYGPLFNGSIAPDKFDETWAMYKAELEDSGILQTIMDEMQRQLDEWAANK